jgi:hypothetical protein
MMKKLILATALFALFSASDAVADVDFGVNVDWSKPEGFDTGDWGVGARLDFGGQFRGIVAFDYFFTDAEDLFDDDEDADLDLSFWEVNGNVAYEFPTEGVRPYLGGGVGFARRTFDDVDDIFDDERTELGLNVLGGVKFGGDPVQGFVEARGTFYPDDEQGDDPFDGDLVAFGDRFVVSAGILF